CGPLLGPQLILGGGIRVIMPPALVTETGFPAASEALPPALATRMLLLRLAAEIWKATVASAPSAITLAFSPQARQVAAEIPKEQVMFLPASVAAGPGLTSIPVTSAGYCMVHRRMAGWMPPLAEVDTVSAALEPGIAAAELSDTATCC